jgi:hypothetical protein
LDAIAQGETIVMGEDASASAAPPIEIEPSNAPPAEPPNAPPNLPPINLAESAQPTGSTEQPPSAHQEAPPDLRARMIEQFERWLDEMLADEPPPRGIPEDLLTEAFAAASAPAAGQNAQPDADLYTLFSALTKLTGEIGLQGRAFKQLTELLTPLSQTPAMLSRLHGAQAESANLLESFIEDQARAADDEQPGAIPLEQVCALMIDLHDRLQRGLQTCGEGIEALHARRSKGGLRIRLSGTEPFTQAIDSVSALRDAGAMTLARLSAALQDWGVQRIGRVGEAFNPDQMSATEVRIDPHSEPGTVLAVNRSGYAIHGIPKAIAHVTVSKTAE